MRTTATVAQMLVRICFLVQIVLGLLFWTGNLLGLVPVHMLVGLLLVLSLWTLAFIGARSGVQPGFVALAFVWGLVVPILGVTQVQLVPDARLSVKRGYREIRYPKMDEAKRKVDSLLNTTASAASKQSVLV